MAIPTPTIPSSIPTVSAVELKPTQNNKAFYIYSGEIPVTTADTTMISINDVGKRDIIFCLELGTLSLNSIDTYLQIKSSGQVILTNAFNNSFQNYSSGFDEIKVILPANTSLEVILTANSGSVNWTIAGYGYYMEHM